MPAARPARALTMSAALVATVLTAAACTATPPASVRTTLPTAAPTSIAPTPSPTPTENPNPAGLKPLPADEIDASFVTIENFFRAYEYALTSGDTAPLEDLSAPSCGVCKDMRDDIRQFYSTGASMTGGGFSIPRSQFIPVKDPDRHVWRLALEQEPISSTTAEGSSATEEGFNGPVHIEVAIRPPQRISGIDTEPDE